MSVHRHRSPARLSVLAVTGALAAVVLAGCGEDAEPVASDPETSTSPSATPTPSSPSTPSTPSSPSPTTSDPDDDATAVVPVYFVGDTPQGVRLFREFRQVKADNPLEGAAALLTAGDVLDRDYRTLLSGLEVDDVTEKQGMLVVQLDDGTSTTRPPGMSRADAVTAVQSLVYTLQGVSQTRLPMQVVVGDDSAAQPLYGIKTAAGVKARAQLDVLALVNVSSPVEGAVVSGTFTADGVASSFEATVPWQVRDSSGDVVLDGFSTAEGWMDRLYPWTTEVDVSSLDPGAYTFVALTDDPSGGEGGGPTEDSKTITVE